MYSIAINDQIIKQSDSLNAAWSIYRAAARLYENKQNKVQLLSDGEILHQKPSGLMLLDDVDGASANDVLVLLVKLLNISFPDAKAIIKNSGLELSNSRIDGWFYPKENRRYVKMYNDELVYLIPLFAKHAKSVF